MDALHILYIQLIVDINRNEYSTCEPISLYIPVSCWLAKSLLHQLRLTASRVPPVHLAAVIALGKSHSKKSVKQNLHQICSVAWRSRRWYFKISISDWWYNGRILWGRPLRQETAAHESPFAFAWKVAIKCETPHVTKQKRFLKSGCANTHTCVHWSFHHTTILNTTFRQRSAMR